MNFRYNQIYPYMTYITFFLFLSTANMQLGLKQRPSVFGYVYVYVVCYAHCEIM